MTETLAFTVTASVVNELLESKGVSDRYNGEMLIINWIGKSFKKMMPFIAEKHGFSLSAEEIAHFSKREEEEVVKVIKQKAKPCKGVKEVLQKLKSDGKYELAVVSSSSTYRIVSVLETADLLQFFEPNRIFSAQSSLNPPKGKPDPAVYFHAMKELGVEADECLTVEDSRTGGFSAGDAEVPWIGYVGCYSTRSKQDQLETSFAEDGAVTTMWNWDQYLTILDKITSN
jgi:HAD superfamily hydrolase (TIGR01509 family)